MRGGIVENSAVAQLFGLGMNHDMDVICATAIATWEEGLKTDNTVMVCLLEAAALGCFNVVRMVIRYNPGVGTCDIGVPKIVSVKITLGVGWDGRLTPDLDKDIRNRITSFHVENLEV